MTFEVILASQTHPEIRAEKGRGGSAKTNCQQAHARTFVCDFVELHTPGNIGKQKFNRQNHRFKFQHELCSKFASLKSHTFEWT